ncbi:MAG: isoprenyl transferase [Bacteroidetes bacterium]|nr:isoprenyl transferase [Bacteroidota bacterium]
MSLLGKIDLENLPSHIAIIMDGNGRWAKKHRKSRIFGHTHGIDSVRNAVEACAELGVSYLTLYAFSTENWDRPRVEITALMKLLVKAIRNEAKQLNDNNVKLTAIGDLNALPKSCLKELNEAIELTKQNTRLTLVLALSYSSRWEIAMAVRKIVKDVIDEKIHFDQINEDVLQDYLATRDIPDPELLIRTSGETRISNFLLWQIAYTELYFTPTLWPDFDKEELYKAILDFQTRERRFGKISEQIKAK